MVRDIGTKIVVYRQIGMSEVICSGGFVHGWPVATRKVLTITGSRLVKDRYESVEAGIATDEQGRTYLFEPSDGWYSSGSWVREDGVLFSHLEPSSKFLLLGRDQVRGFRTPDQHA